MTQKKNFLRSLKSLKGPFPDFDTNNLPVEPTGLFLTCLSSAVEKGVLEPHAMTLSTVDKEGKPDARVLILKNIKPMQHHQIVEKEHN